MNIDRDSVYPTPTSPSSRAYSSPVPSRPLKSSEQPDSHYEPSKKPIHRILYWLPLLICSIPLLINLLWKAYFSSTLTGANLPDYSGTITSSINSPPVQIDFPEPITESGNYRTLPVQLSYLAYYDITGKVLSTGNYSNLLSVHSRELFDRISSYDLCLAWGPMQNALENKNWKFKNSYILSPTTGRYERTCDVRYDATSIPNMSNFSNNHLIPSSKEIYKTISSIKKGDTVHLVGYLVQVTFNSGPPMTSSLIREDTGCEIIYVTSAKIISCPSCLPSL